MFSLIMIYWHILLGFIHFIPWTGRWFHKEIDMFNDPESKLSFWASLFVMKVIAFYSAPLLIIWSTDRHKDIKFDATEWLLSSFTASVRFKKGKNHVVWLHPCAELPQIKIVLSLKLIASAE